MLLEHRHKNVPATNFHELAFFWQLYIILWENSCKSCQRYRLTFVEFRGLLNDFRKTCLPQCHGPGWGSFSAVLSVAHAFWAPFVSVSPNFAVCGISLALRYIDAVETTKWFNFCELHNFLWKGQFMPLPQLSLRPNSCNVRLFLKLFFTCVQINIYLYKSSYVAWTSSQERNCDEILWTCYLLTTSYIFCGNILARVVDVDHWSLPFDRRNYWTLFILCFIGGTWCSREYSKRTASSSNHVEFLVFGSSSMQGLI
jgi:hypothetical protein